MTDWISLADGTVLTVNLPGALPASGVIEFVNTSITVLENAGTASITLRRIGGTVGEIQAFINNVDGTAIEGVDYDSPSPGLAIWADGTGGDVNVTVPITWDTETEGDENFTVTISGTPASAFSANTTATVKITNVEYVGNAVDDSFAAIYAARTGAGENVTGGQGGTRTMITSLTDTSLFDALTTVGTQEIYIDPNLSGTWQKPDGDHTIAGNKTINLALTPNVTLQHGVANHVTQQSDVDINDISRWRATAGNIIFWGIKQKGNLAVGASMTPGANGNTEFIELHDGADYFFGYNDFSFNSDEVFTAYQFPITTNPTNITYLHNKCHNNRNGAIVGSQYADGLNTMKVSSYYNWFKDTIDGRTPFLAHFAHIEAIANVADGFTTDALTGRQGTEIISKGNVIRCYLSNRGMIEVTPRSPDTSVGGTAGPAGLIKSDNDYLLYVSPGVSSFYDTGHNKQDTVFTPTWTHTPQVDLTDMAAIEIYVEANAGIVGL